MINRREADWTLQMFEPFQHSNCFSLHLFAGRSTAQQTVFFFFSLTCSVHHHHFGVFLPQEGTMIGALLAELSLPQP